MTDSDIKTTEEETTQVEDKADLSSISQEEKVIDTPPVRDDRVFTATYTATGRRKAAVARVILKPGIGVITINKRTAEDYSPGASFSKPFEVTNLSGNFDVKVNVNGGAIAYGHPIGASGAKIFVNLIHEMGRRNSKTALATLCIGGGQGIAAVVTGC